MMALSTISITAIEKVFGGQCDRNNDAQREAGSQQRQAGERVAEQECQRYSKDDRPQVREAERGADNHARDFADGAAGQAMQRCAEGDAVQRCAGCRHGRVLGVGVGVGAGFHSELLSNLHAGLGD